MLLYVGQNTILTQAFGFNAYEDVCRAPLSDFLHHALHAVRQCLCILLNPLLSA